MPPFKNAPLEWLTSIFCGFVLLILLHRSLIWEPKFPPPPPPVTCDGIPIYVAYPFESGHLEPHACKVQCANNSGQRFVLYSDGQGTQCQSPPGCLDYGEDRGITCMVPTKYELQLSPVE